MAKFSYNIKANIKTGFGKDALIDDATALGAPILYTLVPTLLGLQGWLAMFVGFIVPYGLGKLFNIPGLSHAAVGIVGTHLMYSKGQGMVTNLFSKPIWTLNGTPTGYEQGNTVPGTNTTIPAGTPTGTGVPVINGLSGVQYITAGNEQLTAYNPREIEAQAFGVPGSEGLSNSTIDDYIPYDDNTAIPTTIAWQKSASRKKPSRWGKPALA